jgi:hypothetical protein
MRYPASEKLEIIRLVEQSHLPVKRTLEKLGIPSQTVEERAANLLRILGETVRNLIGPCGRIVPRCRRGAGARLDGLYVPARLCDIC